MTLHERLAELEQRKQALIHEMEQDEKSGDIRQRLLDAVKQHNDDIKTMERQCVLSIFYPFFCYFLLIIN